MERTRKWEYQEINNQPDTGQNPDQKIEDLDLPKLRGEGSEQEWSYRLSLHGYFVDASMV